MDEVETVNDKMMQVKERGRQHVTENYTQDS